MGKLGIVHCRVCKKPINRLVEIEDVDWVMPSTNYYYHKKCFEQWAKKNSELHAIANDDEWYQSLLYYLNHVIKMEIDYKKLQSQWNNYLRQKTKTAKGIYFAMKYFFEVIHGDKTKASGGIGIISYIYDDSCQYWHEREEREEGICEQIEQQILEVIRLKGKRNLRKLEEIDRKAAAQKELAAALSELGDDE